MRAIVAMQLVRIGFNTRFTWYEANVIELRPHTLRGLMHADLVAQCEEDRLFYITRKGWEEIEEALHG